MSSTSRIYLDNAATSWPKPEAVYQAVDRYQRELGAAAGRGGYAEAVEANRVVEQARASLARLLGVREPRQIVFTFNGTDALNLAIHGLLREGDHVVTTDAEHNSVLRPLSELARHRVITVSYAPCDATGRVDPDDIKRLLAEKRARLVAVTHASNVTGAIQQVSEITRLAYEYGALILIDGAQSVGKLPFTVEELGCDLLAAPGHKGLLGPLGTGLLYVRPGIEDKLASFRQGGTGTHSEREEQPGDMPYKFESGNLNVAGLAGLAAACRWLEEHSIARLHAAETALTERLRHKLADVDGLTMYGPPDATDRLPVLSLNVSGYDPTDVAAVLDTSYRVQVRAGLHCASRIHRRIGSQERGGTVRLSLGPYNNETEVDIAADAIREIAAATIDVRHHSPEHVR